MALVGSSSARKEMAGSPIEIAEPSTPKVSQTMWHWAQSADYRA